MKGEIGSPGMQDGGQEGLEAASSRRKSEV